MEIFLGTKHTADAFRYERVTTSVAVQVNASENWNLEERARQASSEGLSLGSVVVDYASPRHEVDRMVKELRADILTQVQEQIADYARLTNRPWRIGHIEFGVREMDRLPTGKGAYRNDSSRDDSLEHAELADGSERISLRASVDLPASV